MVTTARAHAPAETIATVDSGAHMLAAMPLWEVDEPQRLLISSGLATMGYALPAAIGAALCAPGAPVIAFTGDGGLGMTLMEIETAVRLRLRVVVVVFNDAALSLIKIKQRPAGQGGADGGRLRPDLVRRRRHGAWARPAQRSATRPGSRRRWPRRCTGMGPRSSTPGRPGRLPRRHGPDPRRAPAGTRPPATARPPATTRAPATTCPLPATHPPARGDKPSWQHPRSTTWNPDERDIVTVVHDWVKDSVLPVARDLEHANAYPGELIDDDEAARRVRAGHPRSATAAPASPPACYALVTEELARGWMSLAGAMGGHSVVARLITHVRHGCTEGHAGCRGWPPARYARPWR